MYDLTSLLFNVLKSIFGRAEAELKVAAVEDFKICQVLVLIRAVSLYSKALVTYGGTSESRAGPEARRGIKRRAEQDDLRFFVIAVAADKCLYIFVHASTSISIFSRYAGK